MFESLVMFATFGKLNVAGELLYTSMSVIIFC